MEQGNYFDRGDAVLAEILRFCAEKTSGWCIILVMLRFVQLRGAGWPGGLMISLPGDAEIALRLIPSDSASHGSGGTRTPLEEQLLALFDEMREPLLRYLLSLRVAPQRSEEILQDTFLKLFEHLRSGRSDSNIRGWLFRVAHNLALQELRGRRNAVLDLPAGPIEDPETSLRSAGDLLPHFLHGKSVAQIYHWPAQPSNEFSSYNRESLAHSWAFSLADVDEVLRTALDVRRPDQADFEASANWKPAACGRR